MPQTKQRARSLQRREIAESKLLLLGLPLAHATSPSSGDLAPSPLSVQHNTRELQYFSDLFVRVSCRSNLYNCNKTQVLFLDLSLFKSNLEEAFAFSAEIAVTRGAHLNNRNNKSTKKNAKRTKNRYQNTDAEEMMNPSLYCAR